MKLANSLTMGPGGGQIAKLQLPAQFQKGFKCSRIRMRATGSLISTDAGAYTLTLADVTALMAYIFANITLKFGTTQAEQVDDALPFSLLRLMTVLMTGRDFFVQATTSSPAIPLNQYTTSGAQKLTTPATGSVPFTVEVTRPFSYERLDDCLHDWAPGWTQMKNIQLEVQSGSSAFSADAGKVTVNGNISILVIWDTVQSENDSWARVPRFFRNSIAGLSQNGPNGGGGLLAVVEMTYPAATTPLTDIAIRRGNDEAIHDIILVQDIVREQQYVLPFGMYDANLLGTVLFIADDYLGGTEIPTGEMFELYAPNGDIPQMASAWLYLPTVDSGYADNVIGSNAMGPYGHGGGGRVLLANDNVVRGQKPVSHLASIAPQAILSSEHPMFSQVPGRFLAEGQAPQNFIPPAISAAIHRTVDAHGAGASGDAYMAGAVKNVAATIPGNSSPIRGQVSRGGLAIAQRIGAARGGTPAEQSKHGVTAVNRVSAFFGKVL